MKEFLETLAEVNRSADFCFFTDKKAFFPNIEIKSLGEHLALPLSKFQAKELINVARQAPYGKGEDTVVDASVRKCWEIDGSKLVFHNKSWDKMLKKILRESEEYFDMDNKCLDAELYKLLIYEEGGFFLPHQDSEKIDDMIATLVICLPSKHEGGELVISHAGDEFIFDSANEDGLSTFQSAIFYADCRHELKSVQSGYRLCLTYNVRLKDKQGNSLLAPASTESQVTELANYLKEWYSQKERTSKYVVALNHQYSEANFSFANLKGLDRSQADILLTAGEKAGLQAHLSLIEKYECYDAYESSGYSRRRYWDDEEDDEEIEIGELIDDSLSLSYLEDREGGSFSSLSLDEKEIINIDSWKKQSAHEEDFEGYTGNAGCSMSYWYRYAAVAFWSTEDEFRLLAESSLSSAVDYLFKNLTEGKAVDRKNLADMFEIIFGLLEEEDPEKSWNRLLQRESASKFYDCLIVFDDQKLLSKYIHEYAAGHDIEWIRKRLKYLQRYLSESEIFKFVQAISKVKGSYWFFEKTLGLVLNLDKVLLLGKSPILPYLLNLFKKEKSQNLLEMLKLLLENDQAKLVKELFAYMKAEHRRPISSKILASS